MIAFSSETRKVFVETVLDLALDQEFGHERYSTRKERLVRDFVTNILVAKQCLWVFPEVGD